MNRLRRQLAFKDEIIIEIDSIPSDLNPLNTYDYTSRFICSALYEPLENNINCTITTKENIFFSIELHSSYIGNAQQLLNCFLYHLNFKNKSIYIRSLLIIKGVADYIKGLKSINEIGIKVLNDRKLIIELEKESFFFSHIIQSIYILPVEEDMAVQNGPYKLNMLTSEEVKLIYNPNYYSRKTKNYIKNLTFKLNNNPNDSINLYKNYKIDVSCHTQFLHTNAHYMQYSDFKEINSPMINNTKLRNLINKNICRKDIANNLKNIIIPLYTLTGDATFERALKKHSNDLQLIEDTRDLKIIYADYYPNSIIMDNIIYLLKQYGYTCSVKIIKDFRDYIKINTKEYDISLHLFFPLYHHYSSYVSSFLTNINDMSEKMNILNFLNANDISNLNIYLQYTDNYIPLFLGKSLYIKDSNINGFQLKDNGYLCVKNLEYANR